MRALLGEAAVVIFNDVTPEGREEFYRWHDREHIPERLAIPGFRRGRRFGRRGHSPEWLTLYEADDLAVLTSPAYLARLNAPTPATVSAVAHFRNTARSICRVVHSVGDSTGGHVLALPLRVPAERGDAVARALIEDAFPRVIDTTGIVACHLFAADMTASFARTTESKGRAFDVPPWAVLCEASTAEAAAAAMIVIQDELARHGMEAPGGGAVYALEICRLATHEQPG
ncbi:MAG TPA: hypothetical protein VJV77_00820 [Casimicrobiaceae bacterium]|nr:hypothetical protein [Casimicrobiaceae bacterium]